MIRIAISVVLALSALFVEIAPVATSASDANSMSYVAPARCLLLYGRVGRASPAVGDLDLDGVKDIVVAASDGYVYALRPDCSILSGWPRQVNDYVVPPLVQNKSMTQQIETAPTLADVDGDGRLEVIVAFGWMPELHQNGGVIIFEDSGTVKPGWPKVTRDINGAGDPPWSPDGYTDGVFSTPAVGDIDGDGRPEIVYGAFDKCIYAWEADGTPVNDWWSSARNESARCMIDTIWSSPALTDLDGDGIMDIIIGTDSNPSYAGGSVWALTGDNQVLWTASTTQIIQSSPAIGDLNGDGYPEIAVGTGTYYPQGYKGVSDGHKVYAFDRFGQSLPGWPVATTGNMYASPALADLDQDGKLEILIGCGMEGDLYPSTASCNKFYVMRYDGQPFPGYPRPITRVNLWPEGTLPVGMPTGPIVADYNGDGILDVFLVEAGSWGVSVFPYDNPGAVDPRAYYTEQVLKGAPVIANLYGDSRTFMVAAGADSSGAHGAVYIWQLSNTGRETHPWPMARHNLSRTGTYAAPGELELAPSHLVVLHEYGDSMPGHTSISIRFTGEGSAQWTAQAPAGVVLSPAYGSVADRVSVQITVSTTGYSPGTYNLGDIVISGSKDHETILSSPASINITLFVGEIHKAFLPLTLGYQRGP